MHAGKASALGVEDVQWKGAGGGTSRCDGHERGRHVRRPAVVPEPEEAGAVAAVCERGRGARL